MLDAVEARPLDFHAERRLDARQLHVEAVFDGHGPGVGQPRKLELCVHFLDQLFVGHSGPPLLARLQHDGRVVHIERCVIGRAFGAADGTENALHFWKRADNAVLLLHELRGLRDGNTGQRGRHVKRGAFEQGRHELVADLESDRKREDEENQVQQERGLAKAQAETKDGQIDRLRDAGQRIASLGP